MSGKIGVIVQARMSSTRFPGKSLKNLGEHPLIFYVIRRLSLLKIPVVICTSTHPTDDVLCEYLKKEGFDFFRGSLENVLQRYIMTAEAFGIEKIVRVTGDNPLVDISYLQETLPFFETYNYVDGIYENSLIKGTGFELVKVSELKSIPSSEKQYLEHVTLWLRENLDTSTKRSSLQPNEFNKHRKDIILTCDYPADFKLLQEIFMHFQFRFDMTIEEVVDFLDKNPSLKNINSLCHL